MGPVPKSQTQTIGETELAKNGPVPRSQTQIIGKTELVRNGTSPKKPDTDTVQQEDMAS